MPWARRPVLCALLAVFLAAAWQALTVHYNYHGNWTALYCTGALFRPPPRVLAESEDIYRFPNSHATTARVTPLDFLGPSTRHVSVTAAFRGRLMAGTLAAGEDRRGGSGCLAVTWLWIFAGTFWTACVIRDRGGHPALGAPAFLFIAAVTVSIDRLTIDVAVVSLTAGVIWFADRERWCAAVLLCALSCLARESGPLIPAALVCWELTRRRFRLAIASAGSAAPAFAWCDWVARRTTPGESAGLLSAFPFGGWLTRLLSPALARVLDYPVLVGII